MKKRTILYVFIASFFLFFSLFTKAYLGESIGRLSKAVEDVDNKLYQVKIEEKKISNFIDYKNKVGDIKKAIKVEPVELDVRFSSGEFKDKIDEIVNSTYLERGFFFLDSFRIAESSSDDEETNSKGELQLSLKGRKVLVFGLKQ